MIIQCVICTKKFKPYCTQKTCSEECSKENIRLNSKKYNKKYFADPKIHKKHLKVMREYMRRPDIRKKEKIRKKSPKYKAWWRKYTQTDSYKEAQKKRNNK